VRCTRCVAGSLVLILGLALLVWLGMVPRVPKESNAAPAPVRTGAVFRIGVIPERDVFAQRQRYRALADYLSEQIGRPVELVTVSSYEAIIEDFKDKQVDAAFLGSLVAALAMDRYDAQVIAKPELPSGVSTYRGQIFVREDSPIHSVKDLAGKSIVMVRTTLAGHLFPMYELAQAGLIKGPDACKIIWVGTHDDAVIEVANIRADAGAAKDLRIDAYASENNPVKLRVIAQSDPVPENALVLRKEIAEQIGASLQKTLLRMNSNPAGKAALGEFGVTRFVPCNPQEYKAIYDISEKLAGIWDDVLISGPPPRRLPATLP
jgi:phosphonate transport system substrate-binding protein